MKRTYHVNLEASLWMREELPNGGTKCTKLTRKLVQFELKGSRDRILSNRVILSRGESQNKI